MVKLAITLLLILSAQSIVFSQRTIVDSALCFTPNQVNFIIEQAWTIQEQNTSLILKDKVISTLNKESINLRKEISERDNEINLRILQTTACKEDKLYLEKQLHKALRGKRLFKTGFIIAGGLAITELGYIGLLKLIN